ncbi:MAG: HAD family hydrolase, partial [Phycisphaerales bacterium]
SGAVVPFVEGALSNGREPMNRSAVIFDMDGTLTEPYLDFDALRAEVGVEGPVLEAMGQMDPASRERAEAALLRYEREAAENATLQDGAVEVIDALRAKGHPIAILTRNARATVDLVLKNHGITVDALRTREDGAIKPSPEPVLSICEELDADPRRSWMVGDYLFDIMSGRAAGTHTVLMVGDKPMPKFADQADYVIRRLAELLTIVEQNRIVNGK